MPTTAVNPETGKDEVLSFHALRRWHASNLAANSVSTEMVGKLLGHKGQGTAQRHYIQAVMQERYDAVLKLKLPNVQSVREPEGGAVVLLNGRIGLFK